MSGSANGDQEERKTTSMDESSAWTIESLRAMLISERSVSKSAQQRADELAQRVAELEEQLKFVSLQRKKAEKATADVLAILENRGISDVSEEFDSSSEKDESSRDFKETSTSTKLRNNEAEAYSSSEIESSPSTGRSLSWKSTKDSQHFLEKKKYTESVRRRGSFASNSSLAKRVGKSCRRVKHRETRSMEESQNDGMAKASCSGDVFNCYDGENVAIRGGSGYDNGNNQPESTTLGSQSETEKNNGHYFSGEGDEMQSALQHHAQFIGRYEEEEKAQREWEEKFRENNNGVQESCDPGNHSDVTEERYEMESPELSGAAGMLNSENGERKQEPINTCLSKEPQPSKSSSTLADADKGSSQDEKCSGDVESSASEFSFPMPKEKNILEFLELLEAPALRRQQCLPTGSTIIHPSASVSSSHSGKSMAPHTSPSISSSLELALVPQETSSSLGSVLEALQQAKFSLNQKLHDLPPVARGTSDNAIKLSDPETHNMNSFKVPIVSSSLFRLPTDTQFEVTTRANPGTSVQSSFANLPPEIAPSRFLSKPLVESGSPVSCSLFHTAPYGSFSPAIKSGAPPQRSFSQPRPSEGPSSFNRTNHLDPYMSPALPSVEDTYPYLPHITLHPPLNEEGTSRTFPRSESGLPPLTHLSSYNDRFRPNTYYR